jgi:hypothetical protein
MIPLYLEQSRRFLPAYAVQYLRLILGILSIGHLNLLYTEEWLWCFR